MANNLIDRNGADALIPVELAGEVFQGIQQESAVLRMAQRLPNMTAKQLRLPVLNSLPMAYFVNGDTGMKQTTSVDWAGKFITAEEIAVIVPVPDSVLSDSGFDMWAQIQPLVTQAFGQVIDRAILYGTDKPASWPTGIIPEAVAKGKKLELSAKPYDDIMGAGGLIAKVEQSGYMVSGFIGSMPARGMLRSITDTTGQPIFRGGMNDASGYRLDGQDIVFPQNGAIDPAQMLLLGGDFSQLTYAIRQDLSVKLLTEAVITDADGTIVYNLPQQDMSALRFVMRLGWALPKPKNPVGGEDRYPFAVLAPKA